MSGKSRGAGPDRGADGVRRARWYQQRARDRKEGVADGPAGGDGTDAADRRPQDEPADGNPAGPSAQMRLEHRDTWVEVQIRSAMERGEFENLEYAGKPLPNIRAGQTYDPDWWIKSYLERDGATGVGPEAFVLRAEDARMTQTLDALPTERQVREHLTEFNRRVIEARRQLLGGPPVVTPTRDIEAEVAAWRRRRGC